jgi:hypothetical protein
MLFNLKIKSETKKAYELIDGGWIPKSVLDYRGLQHPYCQIKYWWVKKMIGKSCDGELTALDELILRSLNLCKINFRDLPESILEQWKKYSSDDYDSFTSSRSTKNLEHWNDVGAITDLSFQDVYGDFGY